ncbi:MAG: hypothetical protein WCD18_00080 [Thermosynechococcaceae cyanobacterium]
MNEVTIQFPGSMERSIGFTVPENGQFYVVSFEDLVYYQLDDRSVIEVIEIQQNWDLKENERVILLEGNKIPFIGLWGGSPLHEREGIGELRLKDNVVSLSKVNGEKHRWRFENFSGDWEQVTFDRSLNAFLFGAPYDFDYRYVYFP